MAPDINACRRRLRRRAHLRRLRSDRRRRPAGRSAHAREPRLPSAVGAHRAHRAGHARRRGAARDRRRLGRATRRARLLEDMPVAAFKLGVLGSARNIAAVARDPRRVSATCRVVLDPVLASGPRRRAREARHDRRRCASCCCRRPRCSRRTASKRAALARPTPDASARGLRAAPARGSAAEYVLVTGTHEADARSSTRSTARAAWCARTAGSACRQLPRLGLHARLRASPPRSRSGLDGRGGGARGAGVHLAGARSARFRPARGQTCRTACSSSDEAARPVRDHARASRTATLLAQGATQALDGGVALLQYRDKSRAEQRRRRRAQLAALCRAHGVPLIVNDDVELAAGGRRRRRAPRARRRRPRRARSAAAAASCSAPPATTTSSARAPRSRAGADYVAFGSVFPSPTKPAAVRAPLSLFAAGAAPRRAAGARSAASRSENAPQLIAAGADCVAVISAFRRARHARARARAYA